MRLLTHLECSKCEVQHDPDELHSVCEKCGRPLLCRYDLEPLAQCKLREEVEGRSGGMWRFRELLPFARLQDVFTIGEGRTLL